MKFREIEDGYLLRFDKDEELIGELTNFLIENEIMSGFLHGLGGVQEATIGYYDLEEKKYHFKDYSDLKEVISLNGNVAIRNEKPFLHLHGTFAASDLKVIGGHVKSLIVAGTCEVRLKTFDFNIERVHDEETGLDLLDL